MNEVCENAQVAEVAVTTWGRGREKDGEGLLIAQTRPFFCVENLGRQMCFVCFFWWEAVKAATLISSGGSPLCLLKCHHQLSAARA